MKDAENFDYTYLLSEPTQLGRIANINKVLNERLTTAESKITSDAIVNTVKAHQTNGKNTFALTSQVTQTVDAWVAKFSSSGGANLLLNGGFKRTDRYGWFDIEHSANGSAKNRQVWSNRSYAPSGKNVLVLMATNTTGEFGVQQNVKVKANTKYTLSFYVSQHRCPRVGFVVRNSNSTWLTSGNYNDIPMAAGDETGNGYVKKSVTFNSGANTTVGIELCIYDSDDNGHAWFYDVMLNEGEVALPWSPHHSECYDGSTQIDASGVTIKNGALRVQNNAGQTVISANSEGNLWVQNRLVVGNSTDGRIEVQNESGTAIVNISKHGVSIKNGCMGITTGSVTTGGTGYPDGETRDTTFYAYGMHINEVDYAGSGTTKRVAKYQGGDCTLLADNTGNAHGISHRAFLTPRYLNLQKSGGGNLNFYDTILMDGDSGNIACNTLIVKSNGMCNNIMPGDDAYIGDVNVAHSIGVQSASDRRKGIIYLGNRMDVFVGCDHENGRLNMSARWMDFNAPEGTNFFANVKTHDYGSAGVTGFEAYRSGGHFRIAPHSGNRGNIAFEQFYDNGTAHSMKMIMEDWCLRPNGNNGGILGTTGIRWQEIWCTRGAFNGSDSKLKEDITPIRTNTLLRLTDEDNSITIEDLYNYVKNVDSYTFRYKGTKEKVMGILADEIPRNIFDRIGVMSKTEEEFQEELKRQEELKEILASIPTPLDTEGNENPDLLIEEVGLTYRELREEVAKDIEEPMQLINAPSQVAMLQTVLSEALNKIELLENRIKDLEVLIN